MHTRWLEDMAELIADQGHIFGEAFGAELRDKALAIHKAILGLKMQVDAEHVDRRSRGR